MAEQPLLTAQNRGFKYGDGVFETMRLVDGRLPLAELHFNRLYQSLDLLKIHTASLDKEVLLQNILTLSESNGCLQSGRIRLAVYREEDHKAGYLVEAVSLPAESVQWNHPGYSIGLYPYARKSRDGFANLKSANYLPYVLAGLYAAEKGLDEALVLNHDNAICDASKANLFLVRSGELFTPALHQGCVNGVMRLYLVDQLKARQIAVRQEVITEAELLEAEEVFLTNAIYGVRWIRTFREKTYDSTLSASIFHQIVSPLFR